MKYERKGLDVELMHFLIMSIFTMPQKKTNMEE